MDWLENKHSIFKKTIITLKILGLHYIRKALWKKQYDEELIAQGLEHSAGLWKTLTYVSHLHDLEERFETRWGLSSSLKSLLTSLTLNPTFIDWMYVAPLILVLQLLVSQGVSVSDTSGQPAKIVNLVDGLLTQETHRDSTQQLQCLYLAAGANSCIGLVLLVW